MNVVEDLIDMNVVEDLIDMNLVEELTGMNVVEDLTNMNPQTDMNVVEVHVKNFLNLLRNCAPTNGHQGYS